MTNRRLTQQGDADRARVIVIDDDASMRRALARLLNSVGLEVEAFESAAAFLESSYQDAGSCLILDIRLRGLSGLDLQAELAREDIRVPVIFISGHADVPMSVKAMKAGAIDFLTKPFRDQDLLDAVSAALEHDRKRRAEEEKSSGLLSRFQALKPREQEVMRHVTSGLMNKQIAYQLGLSEITVKIHRGNVMRKMGARSLADLVRMSDALKGPSVSTRKE
jgi:FixJ family two-component response regulator